jgi:hypothetical protein
MNESHISDIARVIQLSIAPVFMLTAIGAIINALMGRLARAVDRRRFLEEHLAPSAEGARRADMLRELAYLQKRIRLVLWSSALAVLSALLVCLLIGTAFAGAFIDIDLTRPVALIFILAVFALTVCLLIFLREISVAALTAHQEITAASPAPERTTS